MIKVAICDDVKMMRQEVKKHLLAYGQKHKNEYCLYEYESGTKLLEDEKEYDLIILDYQYDNDKENDGITVARRIRQKYKYVPIIFLSAYPSVVFATAYAASKMACATSGDSPTRSFINSMQISFP